jgi:hypothetical protein
MIPTQQNGDSLSITYGTVVRMGLEHVEGAPIVTISLGATRVFRLSPMKGKGSVDFEAAHGAVFAIDLPAFFGPRSA